MLRGKNSIITGANRGIGAEIVKKFAQNSKDGIIFACARKKSDDFENRLKELETEYELKIVPIYFDLSDKEQINAALREIKNYKVKIDTHYGLEEFSLMNSIPGMAVLSPDDCTETVKTIEALLDYHGSAYLRLTGTEGNPVVYKEEYDFQIGKAIQHRDGNDIAILATGTMLYEAIRTAELLEKQGVSASVYDVHTIKPIDEELITTIIGKGIPIVTMEEHTVQGGLGSIVASVNARAVKPVHQLFFGLPDCFMKAGDYRYMLEQSGLYAKAMAEKIWEERNAVITERLGKNE